MHTFWKFILQHALFTAGLFALIVVAGHRMRDKRDPASDRSWTPGIGDSAAQTVGRYALRRILSLGVVLVVVIVVVFSTTPEADSGFYQTGWSALHVGQPMEIVARAGGWAFGGAYSNAEEAFDNSYKDGIRVFEADLAWTRDRKLVLNHDWRDAYRAWHAHVLPLSVTLMAEAWFGGDRWLRPDHARFMSTPMTRDLTPMDLHALLVWLRAHPDATVVTNIGEHNLDALRIVAGRAGDLQNRLVPEIHRTGELAPVKQMGFARVIFAPDAIDSAQAPHVGSRELLRFSRAHPEIYAVKLFKDRVIGGDLLQRLAQSSIRGP